MNSASLIRIIVSFAVTGWFLDELSGQHCTETAFASLAPAMTCVASVFWSLIAGASTFFFLRIVWK